MADHPLELALFYDGAYRDVTTDVSQNDPVVITHGGGEVSDAPRASSASFTFEDPDGVYRPYLPTSPLYGKAGRNTPLQVTGGGYFEAAAWEPDQGLSGRRRTQVTGKGVLERVGGWTEPLASAMTRALTAYTAITDLWTLEDARDARQLANPYGNDGVYTNNGLGGQESPGGGDTSFTLNGYSDIFGFFSPANSTTSWQVCFAFKLVAQPNSATQMEIFGLSTTSGYFWSVKVNNGAYRLDILSPDALILTQDISYTGVEPDQWTMMRLQGSVSGGTITWGIGWLVEGDTAGGLSGTVAGDLGRPYTWATSSNPSDYFDGSSWAYIAATTGQSPDLISGSISDAFTGHLGETTGARFLRLATEEGLSATVQGTSDEVMGSQRPDTMIDLLREIRDTDGGYLVDDRTRVGLYLRSRKSMYAQTAALALTYGEDVAPPLKPILDNLGTHNLITVTNRGGGTVTVEDATSAMGSANPPTGVGKAKQDIAVNLRNADRLLDVAYWWLNQGILPDVRYSSVTVDFDANPELEASALAVTPGDRITIGSLDPDVVDLLVIATRDWRKHQKRRTVTFTCAPYRQYDVAVYVATGATLTATMKRYESRTSTTNASLNMSVGIIVVTFTDLRDAWSTTSTPYDWAIAGERITVTAMGAVTGAGPYTQSATVTRSVNGVLKAHAAGEPIHMHTDQQARYAL